MRPLDAEGNPLPRTPHQPRPRKRRNRFRSGGGGQRTQRPDAAEPDAFQADSPSGNRPASGAARQPGGNKPNNRPRRSNQGEAQPRSHESTLFKTHRDEFKAPRSKGNSGQPDPLRTSVDSIRRSARSTGSGGKPRRSWGS